jgi:hypothetical protein
MKTGSFIGTEIEAKVPMPENSYIVKTSEFTGKYDKAGRKVWKHKSKGHPYYLVWDELHGEIEVFRVKSLAHVAVYHANGDGKSTAIKGRYLEFR